MQSDGPLGLFRGMEAKIYQTVATAALMWLLVTNLWPAHLEKTPELKLGPTTPPHDTPEHRNR